MSISRAGQETMKRNKAVSLVINQGNTVAPPTKNRNLNTSVTNMEMITLSYDVSTDEPLRKTIHDIMTKIDYSIIVSLAIKHHSSQQFSAIITVGLKYILPPRKPCNG